MNRRSVLKLALSAPLVASRRAWGQAKTVTLWYPAGDITAGAAHFSDKSFFAPYEAKAGVKVEAVGLDYDTMQQKIFAAAAAKNVGDILFVDGSWVPGFLKEEMLDPVPDARAKAWLDAVSPGDPHALRLRQGTDVGIPAVRHRHLRADLEQGPLQGGGARPREAARGPGTSSATTRRS